MNNGSVVLRPVAETAAPASYQVKILDDAMDLTWMSPGMVLVDVETTGLNAQQNSIIDVCAISWDGRFIQSDFRPRPGARIDEDALRVNGMDLMSLDAKQFGYYAAMTDVFAWLRRLRNDHGQRLVLAGMNPHFDSDFLEAAHDDLHPNVNLSWSHRHYDLHTLAHQYLRIIGKAPGELYSTAICDALQLAPEIDPHTAARGVEWECRAFAKIHQNLRLLQEALA